MSKLHRLLGFVMPLSLVIATAVTTPAAAFDPPFAWAGQMAILTTTPECGGRLIPGDVANIVFRPKLETAEAHSALSYNFLYSAGILKKGSGSLQFNGSGPYAGRFFSGRAEEITLNGTYDLAVTPTTVTSTTDFIQFTGTITNFHGKAGCTVTVRAFGILRP